MRCLRVLDGCLVPDCWRNRVAGGAHAPIWIERSRRLSLALLCLLLRGLPRRSCLRLWPAFTMRWVHLGVCDSSAVGEAAWSLAKRVADRKIVSEISKSSITASEKYCNTRVRGMCSVVAVVQLLGECKPCQLELVLIFNFGGQNA